MEQTNRSVEINQNNQKSNCAYGGLIQLTQRRQWHPTPVLLPGRSHGQRSLVDYSPRDCKELDTTERRLHFTFKP